MVFSFDGLIFECAFSGQLDCPVSEYSPVGDSVFYPVFPEALNVSVNTNFNVSAQVLNPTFDNKLSIAINSIPDFSLVTYKNVFTSITPIANNLAAGTYYFDFKADSLSLVASNQNFDFKIIIDV